MLIGCWLGLATRCCARFTSSGADLHTAVKDGDYYLPPPPEPGSEKKGKKGKGGKKSGKKKKKKK